MAYGFLQRWRRDTRSAVIEEPHQPGPRTFRLADLEPGWAVFDAAGRRVGAVARVEADRLVIRRGLLAQSVTVPATAIREARSGRVELNVALE